MKITLMTLALALISLMPYAYAMDKEAMTDKAPITAVIFYADSCGACKILDPKMKEALNAINQDRLEIVKFDFSNKTSIEATKTLATSKGLDATLQQYGAKTGFVVLVNQEGNVVETLKASHEVPELAAKIASALAQAS